MVGAFPCRQPALPGGTHPQPVWQGQAGRPGDGRGALSLRTFLGSSSCPHPPVPGTEASPSGVPGARGWEVRGPWG